MAGNAEVFLNIKIQERIQHLCTDIDVRFRGRGGPQDGGGSKVLGALRELWRERERAICLLRQK